MSEGPATTGRARHATALLPALEEAARRAGGWAAVSLVAVGLGPGSFTGLRIGIATARALAASAGVAVAGICTLDALAAPLLGGLEGGLGLALIDARRGEVFAALYSAEGRVWGPIVAGPGELVERLRRLDRRPQAVGSGALRFRDELAGSAEIPDGDSPLHRVAAREVCGLGARTLPGRPLEPIYLRPPDAERWRDRDSSRATPG